MTNELHSIPGAVLSEPISWNFSAFLACWIPYQPRTFIVFSRHCLYFNYSWLERNLLEFKEWSESWGTRNLPNRSVEKWHFGLTPTIFDFQIQKQHLFFQDPNEWGTPRSPNGVTFGLHSSLARSPSFCFDYRRKKRLTDSLVFSE